MSAANQQATDRMSGVGPTWSIVAGGAIALVVLTAAMTWIAYGALAPRAGVTTAAATAATSSIADPALVEFRQGEQRASSSGGFVPALGLVQFRQGEQGAPIGAFIPSAGLIDFRHGEQAN